ncbi:MAG: hypothetical protein DWP97_06440 [Calditrichaeota bacterium]|nr:MAG: hypothetical protein DWP97_06440 [Calditrichota bacterium]
MHLQFVMECYFGSYKLPDDNQVDKSAIVVFSIPDLGIKFKAPFDGVDDDHNDFASLLALLEFIDGNQKYFSNSTYQIYGNNLKIINQVNNRETPPVQFSNLLAKASKYREKYRYSLEWISVDENPVFQKLFD